MLDLSPLISDRVLVPLVKGAALFPSSLSIDSRKVEKGGFFVAIPGTQHNGKAFVEEALRRGAVGVVAPHDVATEIASFFKERYPEVAFFETQEIRKAASLLASYFYPLQSDTIVAVTGTNGKTSVVSFIRQIWGHLGLAAASLGNLGLIIEGAELPPPTGTEGLNTPDPVKFHQILQDLKQLGVDHLAFEASSHGLHQHRLDSVHLKAGIFTNFSNDHLDYHHTLGDYLEAKTRLFREVLKSDEYAILNADIPEYKMLLNLCKTRRLKTLSFGKQGDMVRLVSLNPKADGQDISLIVEGKPYNLTLSLVGQFQVYNLMAALSAVIVCGAPAHQAIEACLNLKGVAGRLEQAAPGIYVDYAHTPDALSSSLAALRPHTKGKLWLVFGCGGERDPFKRPMMGEVAAILADNVIITDDNPRHENPAEIRRQILEKCPEAKEVSSRSEAIRIAIENKEKEDVVLIAGKGHETYQVIGDQVLPFNDSDEVRKGIKS